LSTAKETLEARIKELEKSEADLKNSMTEDSELTEELNQTITSLKSKLGDLETQNSALKEESAEY